MLESFNVTLPFFGLVLCGYLAARYKRLPLQAVAALNGFVLWFALPAMLFRFVAGVPIATVVQPGVFFAYTLSGLAIFGLTVAGLRWGSRDNWIDTAFGALAASWPNWGYMGFGMIPAILGPQAIGTMIAAGMADLLVLMSVALAVASREQASEGRRAVLAGLLSVTRNPLMWAIVGGLLMSLLDLQAPKAIDEFLRLLGTAAGPVALFSIGVSLYRPKPLKTRSDTWILVVAKLVLHPLLAWIVAVNVFGLPAETAVTIALVAALPAAGTAFLFTEKHGGDIDRVAAVIMISTALAFVTFSLFALAVK